jgi:hypothetical protein
MYLVQQLTQLLPVRGTALDSRLDFELNYALFTLRAVLPRGSCVLSPSRVRSCPLLSPDARVVVPCDTDAGRIAMTVGFMTSHVSQHERPSSAPTRQPTIL